MSTYQQNIHTIYIFTQSIIVKILASLTDPSPGLSQGGGGARGAQAPPVFGRSVNPISTRGGKFSPPSNTSHPGFSDLATAPLVHYVLKEES